MTGPVEEFDGGTEEDADFAPAVGQPVVIEVRAWLDEDGYYTWDGEGGIRAGDVLSVRPSDGGDE